jgi:acetylornithine/succinyldiaminopimelate/putrescine aminotransferase/predicted amino acid dehydrogenase/acyl carrier protein
MSNLAAKISNWLNNHLGNKYAQHIDDNDISLASLGIDSITVVDLVVTMEKELNIKIPLDSFYTATTKNEFIASVLKSIASAPENSVSANTDNYTNYVNPKLAEKLAKLKIDRTFIKAEGAYLYDREGNQYLDFLSQYGAVPFGYDPAAIWQAIYQLRERQEPSLCQPSLMESAGNLANRLIALAPAGLRYVTFTNSGAETVEVALKMARNATGRKGVLSTRNSFHGKTFAALSATGNPEYQAPFLLPLEEFSAVEFNNLTQLENAFISAPDKFACFIVEPIQGEGGVVVPDRNYLAQAGALCKKYGVVFIVDEIQTGLGRTGHIFYCNELGVKPDILLCSKALGGGLVPVGAVLSTQAVYTDKFALKHSSTFAGNALAMTAGIATLQALTENEGSLLKHIHKRSGYLKEKLTDVMREFPDFIKEVRGQGLMLGIRFTSDRSSWYQNFLGIAAEEKELTQLIASYLLNVERVRVAPTLNRGNILRIQPPYIINEQQCDRFIQALRETLNVLSTRNTGIFYRAILERKKPDIHLLPVEEKYRFPTAPENITARFGFIIHPVDTESYRDYDPSLSLLNEEELKEFSWTMSDNVEPVVGSSLLLTSKTGATVYGDFIMIAYTADELKKMPTRKALQEIDKAISLAVNRGAKIVGLGAYTSIVSGGGEQLIKPDVALTSGNSFTTGAGLQAIELALKKKDLPWTEVRAAIIGATGAIGSCLAVLLSSKVSQLVLVGNPAREKAQSRLKLCAVIEKIIAQAKESKKEDYLPGSLTEQIVTLADSSTNAQIISQLEAKGNIILTTNSNIVGLAEIVITAISTPETKIDNTCFKKDAIVLDISKPNAIHKTILSERPDLLVIDGGIIALPNNANVGPYGTREGTCYACMAETILMALEKRFENVSLGNSLNAREVLLQLEAAKKHGISLAGLQSFGKPIA